MLRKKAPRKGQPAKRGGVLLVGLLPPPPGGVQSITGLIWDSPLRAQYNMHLFDIRNSRGPEWSGRFDWPNFKNAGGQFIRCARLLRQQRPKVFHSPIAPSLSGSLRDLALLWLGKTHGSYTIGHCHGDSSSIALYERSPRWRKATFRLLLRGADHLIVLSPYWARHYKRLAPHAVITILPNAVRPEFLACDHRPHADRPDPFRIVFVGAIGKRKGVHDLVDAAAMLRRIMAPPQGLVVRVVGAEESSGQLDDVVRRVRGRRLGDVVTFVGPKYGDELLSELRDADVFVLPSHNEGQPVALLEAMATGSCVVSTSIPPIAEVVTDGTDGRLVPPGDAYALAAVLASLYEDGALRHAYGRMAAATVRGRFTADTFLQRIDDVYSAVVAPENGAARGLTKR